MTRDRERRNGRGSPLESLFGRQVLCAWSPLRWGPDDLLPEERAHVVDAVERRQCEFATGRVLARQLLEELGIGDRPLLPGRDRSPRWPTSVVGSIAHSAGHCAVVIARSPPVRGLGVDIEPAARIERKLWRYICTKRELAGLTQATDPGHVVRLLFSAKESTYKCFYPLLREAWSFQDVEIELRLSEGGFEATVPGTQWGPIVHRGAFRVASGLVVTGMVVDDRTALPEGLTRAECAGGSTEPR